MRRPAAAIGSWIFFVLAPGVVAGLIPWWLTRWRVDAIPYGAPLQLIGIALIAAGTPVLLHAFARFVVEGSGTPAPVAPTDRLVVGGPYRYVRNPMYLAVVGIIVGQTLALGRLELLWYAGAVAAAMVIFVRAYEEPRLARRHGEAYEAYRRAVPGWLPQLRPWTPDQSGRA